MSSSHAKREDITYRHRYIGIKTDVGFSLNSLVLATPPFACAYPAINLPFC